MQRDGSYSHDTAVTSPNVGQRLKFYGRCSCGWRSRMYPKFVTARFEADLHERVEGIKRELREALVPNDSNSPAVQRWAIAFSEHERGRKTYTDAGEEMAREQEATADAIKAAGPDGLWVELLDGTRLLLRLANSGEPFVRVLQRPPCTKAKDYLS